MSWSYKGEEFTDDMIPKDAIGIIYIMGANIDGEKKLYIGKKMLYTNSKQPLNKKEQELRTDNRTKNYKNKKYLSYRTYYSSNDVLTEHKKKGGKIYREILCFAKNKIELTYLEAKYLFSNGVLEKEEFLNTNILGTFYKNNLK